MVSLKMAQDDHTEQEMELLKDKKDLKAQVREQELAHQEEMRTVKLVSPNNGLYLHTHSTHPHCMMKSESPKSKKGEDTGEIVRRWHGGM